VADVYVATSGNDSTGDGSSGNPYASPGKAVGVASAGDTIWVKAGTYSITSTTPNISGGRVKIESGSGPTSYCAIRGYETTIGDRGAKPVLQPNASFASSSVVELFESGSRIWIDNLTVDGSLAGSGVNAFLINGKARISNCEAKQMSGNGFEGFTIWATDCYAYSCSYGFKGGSDGLGSIYRCVARSCGNGFASFGSYVESIAHANSGDGFALNEHSFALMCVSYGNGLDGFDIFAQWSALLEDCVAVNNGSYGVGSHFGGPNNNTTVGCIRCAGYNNTSGNFRSGVQEIGTISLTGDPFTNAAGGDFSPNSTAGAGAALRGLSTAFPGALSTSYLDLGAVQHQDSGGGGSALYGFTMEG
jgi:hypothetical protein